jgi:O-antigen ligase
MVSDQNPFLGVGLNNYRVHLLEYDPALAWIEADEEFPVKRHLRFIAAPQNGFLFVLAETGILGLGAFLLYIVGVLLIGMRATFATADYRRAAHVGLVIGILGVLGQQAIDYSFWVDPVLYTFTLIVGMLNNASVLSDPRPQASMA